MMKIRTYLIVLFVCLSLMADMASGAVVVNQLTGVSSSNLVYSGLIPISDKSSDNLFFTYYGIDGTTDSSKLKDSPLIVVVGSPGSSAQYLNMGVMGPITLKKDMTVQANDNRATKYANVMFIDVLGTGFSFAADTDSLPIKYQDYGVHLTYAINAFAKESELGQSSIVVLAGEGTFLRALPGLDDIDTLSGIVHFSAWPELYAVGKYYGVAGKDLAIFGDSEKVAIEFTFISCYNLLSNKKYPEAHNCYDSVLNFVESKTKNANLFNVALGYNLTEHLPMIQYYFSQSNIVSLFKAPTTRMFETQSNWISMKTYGDLATNKTTDLSHFMKDYLSIRHFFISGENDYIAYKQSLRIWLETELSYIERESFSKAKLQDIEIDGKIVGFGKQVKQVKYAEILNAGHYVYHDQPAYISNLMKGWVGTLTSQGEQMANNDFVQFVIKFPLLSQFLTFGVPLPGYSVDQSPAKGRSVSHLAEEMVDIQNSNSHLLVDQEIQQGTI